MGILDVLKKAETHKVEGVVERFGVSLHETNGNRYCLILVGSPHVYLIWSDREVYPIGLTIAGDKVSLLVDNQGSGLGRDFNNDTLNERLPELAKTTR